MTDDEVWARVHKFASDRLADGQPVFTSTKGVRNFITDVVAGSIGRRSDAGKTNASRVTRGEVERLWAELNSGPPADVLLITRALLAHALENALEVVDGKLRLRADPLRFEESVEAIEGGTEPSRSQRQGFVIDPILRHALESHAMNRAQRHFEGLGYEVDNSVHKVQPYDLLCRKPSEVVYVEVKATTTVGDAVRVTANEVEFARMHEGQVALFIVHSIEVTKEDDDYILRGGTEVVERTWRIGAGELTFFWTRPSDHDGCPFDDDAFSFASDFSNQAHIVDPKGRARVREFVFKLPREVRAWLARRRGRVLVASRVGPGLTQRLSGGLPAQSEVVLLGGLSSMPLEWAHANLAHEIAHVFHRDRGDEATDPPDREAQADLTAASWGFRDGLIAHHEALADGALADETLADEERKDTSKNDLLHRIDPLRSNL